MPALWTGSISFGLVTIPVSLVTAETREELDFTLLDRRDDSPIGYQKINKHTGKPVPGDQIVRGFEYTDGRYVVLSDADLKRASPERTQRIDVLAFVEAGGIAPLYFDRPYYLEPAKGGEKGYALFREALRRTGRVAVASVVVKTRQHLAAIVVQDNVLVLDLLRYAAELKDPGRIKAPPAGLKGVSDREVEMAERLIDAMTETWKPERYRDEYKDELLAFIEKRGRAGQLESAPEEEEKPARKGRAEVIDIADLLQRSLSGGGRRARGGSSGPGTSSARRTRVRSSAAGKAEDRRRARRRKTA
ncbi:MAG TPA: Ku protein [Methylomirabilota bacterium]|nr:Ku protein [Methylomirabilota bacterium]